MAKGKDVKKAVKKKSEKTLKEKRQEKKAKNLKDKGTGEGNLPISLALFTNMLNIGSENLLSSQCCYEPLALKDQRKSFCNIFTDHI